MAKKRVSKEDFSLEMVFGVTRHKRQTWRKEIDAPTEEDALRMAEAEGTEFETGAKLLGTGSKFEIEVNKPTPESGTPTDGLLSIPQAAVRMNVTERWLYRNWKTQKLGTKVSHRQVRISERAIERYLRMRQP